MGTLGNAEAAEPLERLVFFGTPAFAVPTLDALLEAGRAPELIVSQPTRAAGRGRRPTLPPVATWALDHGIELFQTEKVKDRDFLEMLRERRPQLAVVVAFGQIFRKPLLELPDFGCMNLHASLLPAYRGAAPIVGAIRNGETSVGVSTMVMERGLDSGPVLLQKSIGVGENDNAAELTPRLASLGGSLVVETLECFERGALIAREQDHDAATYAPMLKREEGDLDWTWPASNIHNLVRAFVPWPGTRTTFRGEQLSIKETVLPDRIPSIQTDGASPGEVLGVEDEMLLVRVGGGEVLGVLEVQRPGRRAVSAVDFVNGERVVAGDRLGSSPGEDRSPTPEAE